MWVLHATKPVFIYLFAVFLILLYIHYFCVGLDNRVKVDNTLSSTMSSKCAFSNKYLLSEFIHIGLFKPIGQSSYILLELLFILLGIILLKMCLAFA